MKHKTALTSAMAISGVVVAGTAALAANSGLFDGVGAQPTSSTASTVSVVEVTVPQVDASAPDEVQTFVVDRAGQVVVERKGSALKLRSAASTDGWTAAGSQPSPDKLAITFTKGSESVVFSATGSASGIEASVLEPVTRQVVDVVDVVVPVPAASGGSAGAEPSIPLMAASAADAPIHDPAAPKPAKIAAETPAEIAAEAPAQTPAAPKASAMRSAAVEFGPALSAEDFAALDAK